MRQLAAAFASRALLETLLEASFRRRKAAASCRAPKRAWESLRNKMEHRSKTTESDDREAGVSSRKPEARTRVGGRASNLQTAGAGPRNTPGRASWDDCRFLKACRGEPVDATPIWLDAPSGPVHERIPGTARQGAFPGALQESGPGL